MAKKSVEAGATIERGIMDLRLRPEGYNRSGKLKGTDVKPYWARRPPGRDGKRENDTFHTLNQAREWLAEGVTANAQGKSINVGQSRQTFHEYSQKCLELRLVRPASVSTYRSALLYGDYVFGDMPMIKISMDDTKMLLRVMAQGRPKELKNGAITQEPLSTNAIKTYYGMIKSVFAEAVESHIIPASPFPARIKRYTLDDESEHRKIVPLTFDQVCDAADTITPRLRDLVLFAAATGMRQGELRGLSLNRVDFDECLVTVNRQVNAVKGQEPEFAPLKTGSSKRLLPVAKEAIELIREHVDRYPIRNKDGLIFTTYADLPMSRQYLCRHWRKAADRAHLPGKYGPLEPEPAVFHDLRHFYASALLRQGESLVVVGERLGHSRGSQETARYAHLWHDNDETSRAAISAVFNSGRRKGLRVIA